MSQEVINLHILSIVIHRRRLECLPVIRYHLPNALKILISERLGFRVLVALGIEELVAIGIIIGK